MRRVSITSVNSWSGLWARSETSLLASKFSVSSASKSSSKATENNIRIFRKTNGKMISLENLYVKKI